jgi:hypothetical protein
VLTRSLYTIQTGQASESAANLEAETADSAASRRGIGGSGDNQRSRRRGDSQCKRARRRGQRRRCRRRRPPPPRDQRRRPWPEAGLRRAHPPATSSRTASNPTRRARPRNPPPPPPPLSAPAAELGKVSPPLRESIAAGIRAPRSAPDRRIGGLRIGDREIRTGASLSLSFLCLGVSRFRRTRELFLRERGACLLCCFLRLALPPFFPAVPSLSSVWRERGLSWVGSLLRAVPCR